MHTPSTHDLPIVCDLMVLAPELRTTHLEMARQLFGVAAAEVLELADGYAMRYAADQYDQVVAFIAAERQCCPFFTFTLEVTPAQGPIWLRMTGAPGVKELIQSTLGSCQCS